MRKRSIAAFLSLSLLSAYVNAQFITNNGLPIANSTDITTNGDWTNDGPIINNGTIATTASFQNNGTLDASGRGGFVINYTSEFPFNPGGKTIGFLIKDGPGRLVSQNGLIIRDSLILNRGLLALQSPTDTITLLNQSVIKARPNSYVEGIVSHSGSGNLLFPIGVDGLYLPITLFKATAEQVTASLQNAPASHTAGSGVDALIGFPYAWRVDEKNIADTAAYVELSYPNTLPVVDNPIVVRQAPGNTFTSMGARFIENNSGRVTVRSYSRGLKGLFTIAQGFPLDLITDSLALLSLYDSTNGDNWTNKSNWKIAPIDSWFGVTRAGQTIVSVSLSANNLSGVIPDQFTDIQGLETVDVSGNSISAIPDFTLNTEITSLDVSSNQLTFETLEPNASVAGITYTGQALVTMLPDTLVEVGEDYIVQGSAGGDSTVYNWSLNGTLISGSNEETHLIDSINRQNMGMYAFEASNALLPNLVLSSKPQSVQAYATISGNLFASENNPATSGSLTLLKIKENAFDTTAVVSISNDGSYLFDKIVLDDYQLSGFADTLVHEGSLPTYYDQKLFWEEADTIVLENHLSAIDITSEIKPLPSTGSGEISGIFEEEISGGRADATKKNKRVGGAAVSARRVERTGRTKADKLILTSYVFTDDNGEFSMKNLPEGEYLLNLQYPGFPMDTLSDVRIQIGGPLESVVSVEAKVIDGKVNVRKLVVTGLTQVEGYHAEVFPNPAVEYVRFNFANGSRERKISIVDITGKVVLEENAFFKQHEMKVTQLPKGLYVLNIYDNNRSVKTLKMVIE